MMMSLVQSSAGSLLKGASSLIAEGADRTFWMPPQFSNHADSVDGPFYFITWVCIFFFVLVVALMLWFMWKYSRARGAKIDPDAITHHTPLEITWSFIPLVLVIVMFYVGFAGYMNMEVPPKEAYTINVEAKQWSWGFQYDNGWIDPELHVWAGENIKLVMRSADVLHALFIPDFRVKRDIVPGKFSTMWFVAENKTGQDEAHHLFCAEYCGTEHSDMYARVIVHPTREGFQKWLDEVSDPYGRGMPPEAIGDMFYRNRGCTGCHLITGLRFTGPPLDKTWGEVTGGQRQFAKGPALDTGEDAFAENYVETSLYDPNHQVVEGFGVPSAMSTYKGQLSSRDVQSIIAFLKWMHENEGFDPEETPYLVYQREHAEEQAQEGNQ